MPEKIYKKTANNRKNLPVRLIGSSGRYTMSDAADLWMQSQKNYWKPGTYTVYLQHLTKYILPFFGDLRLNKITEKTMERFAAYLTVQSKNAPLSENYVSQIFGTVRRILIFMEKKYFCRLTIPCNLSSKGHSRRIVLPSADSLNSLEQYLASHCEEDTCLGILIAFHTGIRIGELSALTWHDIDLKEGLLSIRKSILRVKDRNADPPYDHNMTRIVEQSPKTTESSRIVPLPDHLLSLLRQYKKEKEAYVISGCKNPWAEPRTIQYRFKTILRNSNIEYFNFHMLRHAFATRCVSMGLDIKSLSEILGHSSIQITLNLYVHTTVQQKKLFMHQYSSFLQYAPQTF